MVFKTLGNSEIQSKSLETNLQNLYKSIFPPLMITPILLFS
jgi:hypothetical protein